jgi:hypothetical protein
VKRGILGFQRGDFFCWHHASMLHLLRNSGWIDPKEEKKSMASRKHAAQQSVAETTAPVVESPVVESPVVESPVAATVTSVAADDLAYLTAQRKALQEQIKAAKAAQPAKVATPKVSPLEAVIARQATITRKWLPETLAWRVSARVKAGQDQGVALEAVLAQARAAVEALLAQPATATTDEPEA